MNFFEKRFSGPAVLGVDVADVPLVPGIPAVAGVPAVGVVRDGPYISAAVDLAGANSQSMDTWIPLRLLVSMLLFLLLAYSEYRYI